MNAYSKIRARPGGMSGDLPLQDYLADHQERLQGGPGVDPWLREFARPSGVPEGKGWVQDGYYIEPEGYPSWKMPPAEESKQSLFSRVRNVYGKIQGGPQ